VLQLGGVFLVYIFQLIINLFNYTTRYLKLDNIIVLSSKVDHPGVFVTMISFDHKGKSKFSDRLTPWPCDVIPSSYQMVLLNCSAVCQTLVTACQEILTFIKYVCSETRPPFNHKCLALQGGSCLN